MKLWLADIDEGLVGAWRDELRDATDVHIRSGDILSIAEDTLVSPANSYGWMDGGIDAVYTERFGLQLQARLQREIDEKHGGKLAVGSALFLTTGDPVIRNLISAPTMENPEPVPAHNAFFAMMAALKCARRHAVKKLFCPGLTTGIGGVDPREAAHEMAQAWRKWRDAD